MSRQPFFSSRKEGHSEVANSDAWIRIAIAISAKHRAAGTLYTPEHSDEWDEAFEEFFFSLQKPVCIARIEVEP